MLDFLLAALILGLLAAAIRYIVKAKKSGVKCIGCPSSGSCSSHSHSSCGCSGGCGNCSGCDHHSS